MGDNVNRIILQNKGTIYIQFPPDLCMQVESRSATSLSSNFIILGIIIFVLLFVILLGLNFFNF